MPGTKARYTTFTDMTPSDPTTMLTATVKAQALTTETGQVYTMFIATEQLYRVMVNVLWVYPELFINFISCLGGIHLLMSFVGCIGSAYGQQWP